MDKNKLIEEYLSQPLKIGDRIEVMGLGSNDKTRWGHSAKVIDIIDDIPYIEYRGKVKVTEEWRKSIFDIGVNPFPEDKHRVDSINFQLSSILHQFKDKDEYDIDGSPIMSVNFNPFVIINGEKKYYQRPLVWSLEDKQLLIESIYNNVDCGKILVRKRDWGN